MVLIANLISYVCFQTILKTNCLTAEERNLEIVQLDIFKTEQGRCFERKRKIALISLKTHYFGLGKIYSDDSKCEFHNMVLYKKYFRVLWGYFIF